MAATVRGGGPGIALRRIQSLSGALSRWRATAANEPRRSFVSGTGRHRAAPVLNRLCSEGFQGFAGDKMALEVEGVVDSSMGR